MKKEIILTILCIIIAIILGIIIIQKSCFEKNEPDVQIEEFNENESEELSQNSDNENSKIPIEDDTRYKVNKKEGDGSLLITVVDSQNNRKKGAVIEIYDNEGYVFSQIGTDENGYAGIKGLAQGTYFFKQIETPEAFELNETLYKLTVSEIDKTFYKTIIIQQKNKSQFAIKLTDEDENPISGAVFTAYYLENEEEKEIKSITTNSKGLAGLKNLSGIQTIRVKQISAPDGYEKTDEYFEFTTKIEGSTEIHYFVNKKK